MLKKKKHTHTHDSTQYIWQIVNHLTIKCVLWGHSFGITFSSISLLFESTACSMIRLNVTFSVARDTFFLIFWTFTVLSLPKKTSASLTSNLWWKKIDRSKNWMNNNRRFWFVWSKKASVYDMLSNIGIISVVDKIKTQTKTYGCIQTCDEQVSFIHSYVNNETPERSSYSQQFASSFKYTISLDFC